MTEPTFAFGDYVRASRFVVRVIRDGQALGGRNYRAHWPVRDRFAYYQPPGLRLLEDWPGEPVPDSDAPTEGDGHVRFRLMRGTFYGIVVGIVRKQEGQVRNDGGYAGSGWGSEPPDPSGPYFAQRRSLSFVQVALTPPNDRDPLRLVLVLPADLAPASGPLRAVDVRTVTEV